LAHWIPVITSGPDYTSGHLVAVIVWDEGAGSGPDGHSTVPAILLSASIRPGTTSAHVFTHYSLLRAAEEIARVPALHAASSANDLRRAFHF
jgi:hypothetical protein